MKSLLALIALVALVAQASPVRSSLGGEGEEYIDATAYTAADYIQDGLVAMWDGIENVGYGLHDDSAAVWVDLVEGRHLTLPKSSTTRIVQWMEDGLYGIGANSSNWADFTWSDLIGSDNDKITISYVVLVHAYQLDFTRYVPFGMTGGDFGLNYGQPNRFYCYFPWAYGGTVFLLDPFVGVEHSLTVMADGLNGYCYASADGLPIQSRKCGDYSARLSSTRPVLFLHTGYNANLDKSWACTLKNIRVYRRVLSETEIAHNWNIDRERFGIGQ